MPNETMQQALVHLHVFSTLETFQEFGAKWRDLNRQVAATNSFLLSRCSNLNTGREKVYSEKTH